MKKKYLLFAALLIGLSPPAKSAAVSINTIKQLMNDYCIPKEGTSCTPSRQAVYSEGEVCICEGDRVWIEEIRACVEPCPEGSFTKYIAGDVITDGSDCLEGSYKIIVKY